MDYEKVETYLIVAIQSAMYIILCLMLANGIAAIVYNLFPGVTQ